MIKKILLFFKKIIDFILWDEGAEIANAELERRYKEEYDWCKTAYKTQIENKKKEISICYERYRTVNNKSYKISNRDKVRELIKEIREIENQIKEMK